MHINLYYLILVIINLSLSTYFFGNKFGGDPEISLILAQNFFEFNPSQFAGSSTPLYVLILSFFYNLFGDLYIFTMKIVNILSLLYFCYFISNIKKNNYGLILLLLNVSFLFQVFYSMENVPFAIFSIAIFHYYFINKKFLLTLALFILLFFIRVESIFFILALLFNEKKLLRKIIILLIIFTLVLFVNYNSYLFGFDLYHAGKLRRILSNETALISIDKLIVLILYIGPTLIFYILYFKKLLFNRIDLLLCVVIIPLILYLFNYLPTTHITRYTSFIFVTLIYLISVQGCDFKRNNNYFNYLLIIIILPIAIATYVLRSNYTGWDFRSKTNIFQTYKDFKNKEEFSNFLYLSFTSNNENLKNDSINILIDEVQLRGRLDNRFIVTSIDGLTDSDFIKYIVDKDFDIEKYIIEKKINIILIDNKSTYFNSFNKIINNKFNRISLQRKYIKIPSKFTYDNLEVTIFYFESNLRN